MIRRAARLLLTWTLAVLVTTSPVVFAQTSDVPAVPWAWRAEAETLFAEGLALAQVARHKDAATKFLAAAARDPARVDALLRAGLALRRAADLDGALAAYGRVLAHPAATDLDRLDATYGLAETHRLRGDVDEAVDLFTRYVAGETRPDEVRFVERARAAIAALRRGEDPAPPSTAPPPKAVHFFGDALVVEALLAEAAALRSTGDDPGAASRVARARALSPPAAPSVVAAPAPACAVESLLGVGELALAKQDGRGALIAFQQARACDPTRAAPLWGLSRAADLIGDRAAGRAHARRYLQARGPDHEPAVARAALWRAEQPS